MESTEKVWEKYFMNVVTKKQTQKTKIKKQNPKILTFI